MFLLFEKSGELYYVSRETTNAKRAGNDIMIVNTIYIKFKYTYLLTWCDIRIVDILVHFNKVLDANKRKKMR